MSDAREWLTRPREGVYAHVANTLTRHALLALLDLHTQVPDGDAAWCASCHVDWPCPTVRTMHRVLCLEDSAWKETG